MLKEGTFSAFMAALRSIRSTPLPPGRSISSPRSSGAQLNDSRANAGEQPISSARRKASPFIANPRIAGSPPQPDATQKGVDPDRPLQENRRADVLLQSANLLRSKAPKRKSFLAFERFSRPEASLRAPPCVKRRREDRRAVAWQPLRPSQGRIMRDPLVSGMKERNDVEARQQNSVISAHRRNEVLPGLRRKDRLD